MVNISMLDRYRGAMVGTLCGDALGAPYEWKKANEITRDLLAQGAVEAKDYQPFDYIDPWDKNKQRKMKAGQPTDDSELAAALAMSIIADLTFNTEDLYYRLRGFIHERKSILTDMAFGTGGTLKAALLPETYAESLEKFRRGEMPIVPSNGSLMRCIAIPLCYRKSPGLPIVLGKAQSRVTHAHPLAQAACAVFSVYVSIILTGIPPKEAWVLAKRNSCLEYEARHNGAINEILAIDTSQPNEKDIWPQCGSVTLSLRAALWASLNAESFADGIVKVIALGGDTDTYAAIAGGMLGAQYGIQGIPEHWQKVLRGREIMISLADQLYNFAQKW